MVDRNPQPEHSTGDNAQKSNTRHSENSCPLAFPTERVTFLPASNMVLKGSNHTFSKCF